MAAQYHFLANNWSARHRQRTSMAADLHDQLNSARHGHHRDGASGGIMVQRRRQRHVEQQATGGTNVAR
jgi:hypothetical protein